MYCHVSSRKPAQSAARVYVGEQSWKSLKMCERIFPEYPAACLEIVANTLTSCMCQASQAGQGLPGAGCVPSTMPPAGRVSKTTVTQSPPPCTGAPAMAAKWNKVQAQLCSLPSWKPSKGGTFAGRVHRGGGSLFEERECLGRRRMRVSGGSQSTEAERLVDASRVSWGENVCSAACEHSEPSKTESITNGAEHVKTARLAERRWQGSKQTKIWEGKKYKHSHLHESTLQLRWDPSKLTFRGEWGGFPRT